MELIKNRSTSAAAFLALGLMWVVGLLVVGFALGISWFFLRKGFIAGFMGLTFLFGCASLIQPTHVTKDEVSLQYDTIGNSWNSAVKRAEELCGGPVEVMSRWDNVGMRGATFRCIHGEKEG